MSGGAAGRPRFRDDRRTLHDFGAEFLVECPRCRACARVAPAPAAAGDSRGQPASPPTWRVVCGTCGLAKDEGGDKPAMKAPSDPHFHLPLWLQEPCCGHTLWAYNAKHLLYLESFVRAELRERVRDPELGWSNRSMSNRLPEWMVVAKHRDEVLKGVERLKRKVGSR